MMGEVVPVYEIIPYVLRDIYQKKAILTIGKKGKREKKNVRDEKSI